MVVSKYFNHTPSRPTQEQSLIEDLIIEQIRLWGTNIYYLPRLSLDKLDPIYGEDPISLFNKAYLIEMYISLPQGDGVQSEFFSKFGLEIRDTQKFMVARRTFNKAVQDYPRPREGDLLYVPFMNNIYEILMVNEEVQYYTLGRKAPYFYCYDLKVELHKFSHDRFLTGVRDIDDISKNYGFSILYNMENPANQFVYTPGETVYQGANVAYAIATGVVQAWVDSNNSVQISNIIGTFSNGAIMVGNTSNAQYTISSFNRQGQNTFEDVPNNVDVELEADKIIDFNTNNPFGTP